ncbi:hypothetical protein ARMSODRAFT_966953 [Armillaria solidipes]|uniref:Uncharacterized protein n=1 Tax=Armillaria solidipes TaxID=1076256 RepID=A0A2H3ANV5_9AGAR|nr:hypothetical protein ARMSODRAFT_966953 [Armillaria solidipes]
MLALDYPHKETKDAVDEETSRIPTLRLLSENLAVLQREPRFEKDETESALFHLMRSTR